ncbi:MAG: hypothetical protein HPY83_11710 [Anaerolineae bacterium]|nr:hypothetical protein [Anaerolineae bacterium]
MEADPEFVIGQMRLQTTEPFLYFRVGSETSRAEADATLDALMAELDEARAGSDASTEGPVVLIARFGDEGLYLEAGHRIGPEAASCETARVRLVEGRRCASLLYWGSLEHYAKAHEALVLGMRQAGLTGAGELREWYLQFEGDSSPDNVMLLQYVLAE